MTGYQNCKKKKTGASINWTEAIIKKKQQQKNKVKQVIYTQLNNQNKTCDDENEQRGECM